MQTWLRERYVRQVGQRWFLNNGFQIDVSGTEQNKNVLTSGTTGGGKTFLVTGICDQVGKGILLDTKGKGRKTIEEIGFSNWTFFDTKVAPLKINASELRLDSVNVLLHENDLKEQRMYNVFHQFCSLPEKKKTFLLLRKMLEAIGQYNLANDLELIFHRQDKGTTIKELLGQKVCWNIRGISQFNRGIGLLIKMIYDYTYLHPLQSPYFLFCDDAQSYATHETTLGKAFSLSFSEGRAFGIITGLCGTHDSFLAYGCKVNADIIFYFPSKKEAKKLRSKGVDFKDARVIALRKAYPNGGVCFVETDLPVFVDGAKATLNAPYPFYFSIFDYIAKSQKKIKKGDKLPIKQDFFG